MKIFQCLCYLKSTKCSLFFILIHLGLINKDSKFLNKVLSFTLPCKGEDYIDFTGEKQIGYISLMEFIRNVKPFINYENGKFKESISK